MLGLSAGSSQGSGASGTPPGAPYTLRHLNYEAIGITSCRIRKVSSTHNTVFERHHPGSDFFTGEHFGIEPVGAHQRNVSTGVRRTLLSPTNLVVTGRLIVAGNLLFRD